MFWSDSPGSVNLPLNQYVFYKGEPVISRTILLPKGSYKNDVTLRTFELTPQDQNWQKKNPQNKQKYRENVSKMIILVDLPQRVTSFVYDS